LFLSNISLFLSKDIGHMRNYMEIKKVFLGWEED